jgi:hypothetical protein
MAKKRSKVVPPPRIPEPGGYLHVRVTRDGISVIKAEAVEHAPRQQLKAPVLTRETVPKFEGNVSELVLAAILDNGTVTESFGWSAEPQWFVDGDVEQRIVSSLLRVTDWEARWWIPWPEPVRYLQFYRSDLVRSPQRGPAFTQTSLAVFDLKPGTPERHRPSFPVPDPRPPVPLPLPGLPPRAASRAAAAPRARKAKSAKAKKKKSRTGDGGFIKKSETLVNKGAPSQKFNVVILGDGFKTTAELRKFKKYADLVKKAVTTTKPFKSLASRINVHKVTVVSTESGISNCPDCGTTRNTFFKTAGCFHQTPKAPTFIGPPSTDKIWEAVETIVPQQFAHLVVTIVNCHKYGGSTPPELGLVFLPLSNTKQNFVYTSLHESGHAIAKLNEEYNPCNERDEARPNPNEATQAEVDAGTVKWKNLALPRELDAAGNLKVVHRFNDPVKPRCQPSLPAFTAAQLKGLGAFWGCHSGDSTAPPVNPPPMERCDPRGKAFYRPMANCRMRDVDSPFCRVCSQEITKVIEGHST